MNTQTKPPSDSMIAPPPFAIPAAAALATAGVVEGDICVGLAVAAPNVVGIVAIAIVEFPTTTTEVSTVADADGVGVVDSMETVETLLMMPVWEEVERAEEEEEDEGVDEGDGDEEGEEDKDETGLGFEMPN